MQRAPQDDDSLILQHLQLSRDSIQRAEPAQVRHGSLSENLSEIPPVRYVTETTTENTFGVKANGYDAAALRMLLGNSS